MSCSRPVGVSADDAHAHAVAMQCRQIIADETPEQAEQIAYLVAGRDQFSELKEKISSNRECRVRSRRNRRRRNASTPRRWPSARGRPRARPASVAIHDDRDMQGVSAGSDPSVAGTATFDIGSFPRAFSGMATRARCRENTPNQ